MKQRFAVLIISGSEKTSKTGRFSRVLSNLRPGSRLQNYSEFLSGSGIPFETVQVGDLSSEQIVNGDTVRFSAIILICRSREIPETIWANLTKYSLQFGISLITDSFLFTDANFLTPFGIRKDTGFPKLSGRILDTEGNVLYRAIPYPYSSKGADFGIRPLLRMLLQSWFAKRVVAIPETQIEAVHGKSLPAVVAHSFGQARNYFLNFYPALVLKDGSPIHTLLRRLILSNPHAIPVSPSLEGVGVLRMDDPGSAERVHLEEFNKGVLSAETWQGIIYELKKAEAHMNVAVVPNWVDDGEGNKGQLTVGGRVVEDRIPGAHYPAWDVEFLRNDRTTVYDYVSSFRAIRKGVEQGVLSILSHGLTHITPDQDRWLSAGDRYTNTRWYREFSRDTSDVVERMKESARLLTKYFGTVPEILVPSGHKFTPKTPAQAGSAGFKVFSSKTTFFIEAEKIFENRKLRAIYPEETSEGVALVEAGYPLIIVLHDYDLLQNGPARLKGMIQKWRETGIDSFMSLANLALALTTRLEATCLEDGSVRVEVDFRTCPRVPEKNPVMWLKIGGKPFSAEVNGDLRDEDLKWTGKVTLFPLRPAQAVDGWLRVVLRFGENI
ncbi:hypothetical protein UR09_02990 [Candidatus Nitromaritima sp. SCGC AAA799-A02]|nr:hypothetical protein UR09_02990 [Candidatus Nitromaritima sp. SCGC AAA799-A02]